MWTVSLWFCPPSGHPFWGCRVGPVCVRAVQLCLGTPVCSLRVFFPLCLLEYSVRLATRTDLIFRNADSVFHHV